jgi:hypothetical protein
VPSIAIQETFVAISAATAQGVLTVSDTSYLFPGAKAWVAKDDGSLSYRVRILARLTSTTVSVRRYNNDDENSAPSYGSSDMTAFNGVSSHICQETQTAPVDEAYAVRVVA